MAGFLQTLQQVDAYRGIKTPLGTIAGMAELLLSTGLSREQQEYAETIHATAEMLLTLADDMHDLAALEMGAAPLRDCPFVLRALAEEVVELLSPRAAERNVELVLRSSPGLPLAVKGDPPRLRQALVALAGSLVALSRGGYVWLALEQAHQDAQAVTVFFEIGHGDTGIDAEMLAALLGSGAPGAADTAHFPDMAGVRFAIGRRLVHKMGGTLIIDETGTQEGALLRFGLVFAAREEEKLGAPATSDRLHGRRVLIVDDYPINHKIIAEYLGRMGLRCDTAVSGAEALQKCREARSTGEPYDFAFIDHLMPGMDGEQLARALRSEPGYESMKMVLLTALGKPENFAAMREAGFCTHLVKPVYPVALLDALTEALEFSAPDEAPERQQSAG